MTMQALDEKIITENQSQAEDFMFLPGSPASAQDISILRELAAARRLFSFESLKSRHRPDTRLDVESGREKLDINSTIAIKNMNIGHLVKARHPQDQSHVFRGTPSRKEEQNIVRWFYENCIRHAFITVDSYHKLQGANTLEDLTGIDTAHTLTAEEKEAAAFLKAFQGKISGKVTTHFVSDDFGDGYYFTSEPDFKNQPGIYEMKDRKFLFLKTGITLSRLCVYNALMKLLSGETILIITGDGRKHKIKNKNDLKILYESKRA